MIITSPILPIPVSLITTFKLKMESLIFGPNLPKNGIWVNKRKSRSITIEFCIFELVLAPNLNLNWQLWVFGTNLPKKVILGQKKKKRKKEKTKNPEHYHWVLHIRISLGSKIQLKLLSLFFSAKFAQNKHFESQTEKVNIAIELQIFQLAFALNFSLNWQLWFFEPNFYKKSILSHK